MHILFKFISNKKIVLITAIITASVLYIAIAHTGVTEADATNASTKYYTCITVNQGDTLWDIADKYMTDEYSSTQEYIDEVVSINDLSHESSIAAGTNLMIPYYKVTDLNSDN